MSRYTLRHEHLGARPVIVLTDADSGLAVRLAHRGATLLNYHVPDRQQMVDIADGYRDAAELEAGSGARFAIMAPFANRIAGAAYRFEGEAFDLQPGATGSARAIRHGFVRGADFELLAVDADARGIAATFGFDGLRPDAHPGYPFAIDLRVVYTLHAAGLDVEIVMRNLGERPAPCFAGWHPYFRLGNDGIDGYRLQVPARRRVCSGDDLLPLPGDRAYADIADDPALDFRKPHPVGDRVIDTAYADLATDRDGRLRTFLDDPATGRALSVWQERGVMLAFTGDTLARDARRAIALEPMEAMADAFNRDDSAAAIALAPGAERRFRCGVEVAFT